MLALILALLCASFLAAQEQRETAYQEPPEEDEELIEKEYSFNPLQASKEMRIGNFYLRKGSYRAAALRFLEATKWDPNLAQAFLRLGEAREKLKDDKGAKEAYEKFLELAPDAREAAAVRRKIAQAGK